MNIKNRLLSNYILLSIYSIIFIYIFLQGPIFSPDTYSYLLADPQRTAGYVVFIKFFELVSKDYYPELLVAIQLLFGLVAVHVSFKYLRTLLGWGFILNVGLFIVLIFPFFPPLSIANNLSSEGISYPLYLLFLISSFQFILSESRSKLMMIFIYYLLLVLTRGQFIITPIILAVVYFFKNRQVILSQSHVSNLILLLLLPIIAIITDKTYHKLKDNLFISTPYSFVNMSAMAFYVSNKYDAETFKNDELRHLFSECHESLKEKKLLMSTQSNESFKEDYIYFHNHVPELCNQTIHAITRTHYYDKYLQNSNNRKAASAFSAWQSEVACQNFFLKLVSNNFKNWVILYYRNLVHGFKSVVVLFLIVGIFCLSGLKIIISPKRNDCLIFLMTALTLSNVLIVCVASHSIMRYLFYNYVLTYLLTILFYKTYINAKQT